jgi:glycosyltransferase involved in cell wall biosynthesis
VSEKGPPTSNDALQVLISAYACEPHQGSEPGVGWNWSVQAASHGHSVHVVTRANNRNSIEAELARHHIPGLHFHYLDLPRPFLWLKRRTGFLGLLTYYYVWQLALIFVARRLHKSHRFDLAHHVTFCADWMPSGLCILNIPFMWGPIGGSTHRIPSHIGLDLPSYAIRHERIRRITQTSLKWVDPLLWLTRRRATIIIPFTNQALEGVPKAHRAKAEVIKHIGSDQAEIAAISNPKKIDRAPELAILTGGRLVHWKGLDLLIEGFGRHVATTGAKSRLVITGDGEYRGHLENLAKGSGVEKQVAFVGRLPRRTDLLELMRESDLYALPTLRDGPPVAILEAMSVGCPVLCLDFGSTQELVPEEAGIRIAVETKQQIVGDIGTALTWADTHRSELRSMGIAANGYVQRFHGWDQIGDQVEALYDRATREATARRR